MGYKTNGFKLGAALLMGIIVLLLPRPEGSLFHIKNDPGKTLARALEDKFTLVPTKESPGYQLKAKTPGSPDASAQFIANKALELELSQVQVTHVDGLSPRGKRFLAVLTVLVILFVLEPIPLEITAILIGASLVTLRIADVKTAWAPYMHPVVIFIMCCLIFAVALDKVGLTQRLGYFIIQRAGNSVVRFTFILSLGLGLASSFMHDAAACAIGIITMRPLMERAGIKPHTNTAKFMMLSLPFACSSGGMGTLVGGGRCMVSAAFLKEFTGIEISFLEWIIYAMPAAIITVPISILVVYLVYPPDPTFKLPSFTKQLPPLSWNEKKTLGIMGGVFLLWLTKGLHGMDYSVTGIFGITALVLWDILNWKDINHNLEWGTALFIFGGGISLGLAMGYSGAANYFAHLFFPYIQGKGWLVLFIGVGLFGALMTNAMANVAAAALILPIVIPMAQLEGVDPTILALCLGMATSFAMLLVIGCPPNAIAYSHKFFKASDLTRLGLVATPVLLTVLVLVALVWWKLLGLV